MDSRVKDNAAVAASCSINFESTPALVVGERSSIPQLNSSLKGGESKSKHLKSSFNKA